MNTNLSTTVRAAGDTGASAVLADYYELVKPSIVWLILMSTAMEIGRAHV